MYLIVTANRDVGQLSPGNVYERPSDRLLQIALESTAYLVSREDRWVEIWHQSIR